MEAYLQVTSQHVKSTFLQPSVSCCVRRQPRLLATSPTVFQASPVLRLELSPAFPRLAFFLGSPQMKPLLGRACWPLLLQATLHSLYCVCGLLTWSLEQARTAALMWPRSAPTLRKHLCMNPVSGPPPSTSDMLPFLRSLITFNFYGKICSRWEIVKT